MCIRDRYTATPVLSLHSLVFLLKRWSRNTDQCFPGSVSDGGALQTQCHTSHGLPACRLSVPCRAVHFTQLRSKHLVLPESGVLFHKLSLYASSGIGFCPIRPTSPASSFATVRLGAALISLPAPWAPVSPLGQQSSGGTEGLGMR